MKLVNVPNAITLLRVALIPVLVALIVLGEYEWAFTVFCVSAISDLLDGFIARRFDLRTRFGAIADPLADKATMLAVTLLLGAQGWLPWWFALLLITRDIVIVAGALSYHFYVGHVEMAPTWLSKFNTVLEFLLLAATLGVAAEIVADGPWSDAMIWLTTATLFASGAQYVGVWGWRAYRTRRTGGTAPPEAARRDSAD